MALSNELKRIKKAYGEKFMQLCRELFPSILENEGELYEILSSIFARNSRTLYEDIEKAGLKTAFQSYIYSKIKPKEYQLENTENLQTPYELLEQAGYTLIECTTEEEIQAFRKYYSPKEMLCTFNGGRLEKSVVFFAVKKDAENIKRQDIQKPPEREDKYGISVLGIQFNREGYCTPEIICRYNHTVDNPNATYGNNLEKIIPGLTQSFAVLLMERGITLNGLNITKLDIPGYKQANDGKYYKYNLEINGTYYCPGNIIIKPGGEVYKLPDPKKHILIDNFILDLENKTIKLYDEQIIDSFPDAFKSIKKIEIQEDKEKHIRIITIQTQGEESPIVIKIDQNNQIVGYINKGLTTLKDGFLQYNRTLAELETPNLTTIQNDCLQHNRSLTRLDISNVINVGDNFLQNNQTLRELVIPNLSQVGDSFLRLNKELTQLKAPNLTRVGNSFLSANEKICQLEVPLLTFVEDSFMSKNKSLTQLNMPSLMQAGHSFLAHNENLSQLEVPSLAYVGNHFMSRNQGLTQLNMPNLIQVGHSFLAYNQRLSQLEVPSLAYVGNHFISRNQGLTQINMPSITQVGDYFISSNKGLTQLNMPNVTKVGDFFLRNNKGLTQLDMPNAIQVGEQFLRDNQDLNQLNMPNLEEAGDEFLTCNQGLRRIKFPKLRQLGSDAIASNCILTHIYLPNLEQANDGFLESVESLIELYAPKMPKLRERFPKAVNTYTEEQESDSVDTQEKSGAENIVTAKSIAILDEKSGIATSETGWARQLIESIKKRLKISSKDEMNN